MITNDEGGYPNGIGHSGSETSEAAQSKVKGKRAEQVYAAVAYRQHFGFTCKELEKALNIGHGAASGALTRLHRAGHLVRLKQTRDGQELYVVEAFSGGREKSPYMPNVAYREGYKRPMALEIDLTPELHEKIEAFLKTQNATGYEAECFLHWLPMVLELIREEQGGK